MSAEADCRRGGEFVSTLTQRHLLFSMFQPGFLAPGSHLLSQVLSRTGQCAFLRLPRGISWLCRGFPLASLGFCDLHSLCPSPAHGAPELQPADTLRMLPQ